MREGWEVKELGTVVKTGAGGTPLKSKREYYENGNIPWLLSGEVAQGEIYSSKSFITEKGLSNSSAKLFPTNSVLIAMYGATAGQVGILRFESSTNQAVCGIFPNENFIPEFLFYFFLSQKESLLLQAVGNAQPNISQAKIKKVLVPIPPLPEQTQIVTTLDKAFKQIDQAKANLEKNLNNAKELFQSKLNEVFSQRGESWEEKKLGDICTLYQGLAINKKTKHLLVEKSNLPLLRIKDLRNNTHEQYVSEVGYPKNSLVTEDEIIYTRTGNSLGLVFRGRKGVLHNNSFKIVPNELLTNDYLYWWLQHEAFTKIIISLASKAAQPDITHKLFKEQIISIPSIEMQNSYYLEIEQLNELLNNLQTHYQQKLNNLEELKKSILQKAFRGEL